MKLYFLAPVTADNDDPSARKARETDSNSIITSLIADCLTAWSDPTLHAVHFREMGDGEALVAEKVGDAASIRAWISKSLDPNDPASCEIRSLLNCRCVRFGYDGQAFLCLRTEDEKPVSPDSSVVAVEDCSNWLSETDYMDGFAPA